MNTINTEGVNNSVASNGAGGAVLGTIATTGASVWGAIGNVVSVGGVSGASNAALLAGAGKGAIGGGLVALLAGLIIKNKSETEEGKALGKGLSVGGAFGSAVGFGSLYTVLGPLMSILGVSLSLGILYTLLSGNKSEAEKIIKDKLGEEKGDKMLTDLEKGLEESEKKELADKEKIRV